MRYNNKTHQQHQKEYYLEKELRTKTILYGLL